MERILLHEKTSLLDDICLDLKQYLPNLEQVKTKYENLNIGDFHQDILNEIVKSKTGDIEKKFNDYLNDQLDKTGITNSILRSNILSGSERLIIEFIEKAKEIKRFKPETFSRNNYLKLNYISFENGAFYLSDENKEQILENECRIYIENEKEKELFDNLKKLIEAYDKVNENLDELQFRFSYNQGVGINAIANTFLRLDEKQYSIRPEALNFATNYKENSLRFK